MRSLHARHLLLAALMILVLMGTLVLAGFDQNPAIRVNDDGPHTVSFGSAAPGGVVGDPWQKSRIPRLAHDNASQASPPQPHSAPAPAPAISPVAESSIAESPASGARPPVVLGYYAEDWDGDTRAVRSLQSAEGQVGMIVSFQYKVDGAGNVSGRAFPTLMAEAAQQKTPVHALIHNYENGRFNSETVRAILTSDSVQTRLIDNLFQLVSTNGFAGVNVDLENVPPELRQEYTSFIRLLTERFRPAGFQVTLSIPAKTADDPRNRWSGAFDYVALGLLADAIVPMAYDESAPGFAAGPVASAAWVERVADYAVRTIGRHKVYLGVAAYGYDWVRGTTTAAGLTAPQALEQALSFGATIQWDDEAQVPYYTYVENGQERIVYYENAASMSRKLAIVQKYGLAGIGIWRLGSEDPAIWQLLRDKL